ncbi:hypothetical protein [Paraburkholderia sacchari]|uniref:hypothetical protein n=1 Tax=Paraburkholderia sacchari TaxID=159450 RepID=UPI000B091E25|nr:hypothetical protein [Paraburkholderia sacchari]
MDKTELNRRAIVAAFGDEAGRLPDGVKPEIMDVIGNSDDCLRLLIATGISFAPGDGEVAAEGGMMQEPLVEKVVGGDTLAAARLAAAKVAASWLEFADQ